ncbi:hypothetical protein Tco_0783058 [Tanacetum coccineum]
MMSTVLDEGRKQAINEYMISGLQPVKIELDKLSKEIMNLSRSINGVPFNNEFLGSDIQEFKEDKGKCLCFDPKSLSCSPNVENNLMLNNSDNVVNPGKTNIKNGTISDDKIDSHKVFDKMSMSSFLYRWMHITNDINGFILTCAPGAHINVWDTGCVDTA